MGFIDIISIFIIFQSNDVAISLKNGSRININTPKAMQPMAKINVGNTMLIGASSISSSCNLVKYALSNIEKKYAAFNRLLINFII